jgi:hypothetical protein
MKYLFLIWCIFLINISHSNPTTPSAPFNYEQFLHDLSGHWVGHGFTMIAVPSFTDTAHDFDLKLFHTHETLVFTGVREHIRNAGDDHEEFLKSIMYLQQVTDLTTNEELHVESGMWVYQPKNENGQPDVLWRAGNIPHGNSFIAGSNDVKDAKCGPEFEEDMSSLPFPQGHTDDRPRSSGTKYTSGFDVPKLPLTMIPKYTGGNVVVSPNEYLMKDIEDQNIRQTWTVTISSIEEGPGKGGVLNIPMLQKEANVAQVEATFFIEKVKDDNGNHFYQLQYTQEVYIDFPVFKNKTNIITWPHVSVATLRKQAGEYVS